MKSRAVEGATLKEFEIVLIFQEVSNFRGRAAVTMVVVQSVTLRCNFYLLRNYPRAIILPGKHCETSLLQVS